MNVIHMHDQSLGTVSGSCRSVPIRSALSRTALVSGAAARRARAAEIEADIDHACELAALRPDTCSSAPERRSWDRRAWNRTIAEAVRQAQAHADELGMLRRQAAQLDRLVRVS